MFRFSLHLPPGQMQPPQPYIPAWRLCKLAHSLCRPHSTAQPSSLFSTQMQLHCKSQQYEAPLVILCFWTYSFLLSLLETLNGPMWSEATHCVCMGWYVCMGTSSSSTTFDQSSCLHGFFGVQTACWVMQWFQIFLTLSATYLQLPLDYPCLQNPLATSVPE